MTNTNHTFIIPAYKNSIYLEDCIRSLKQQNSLSKILLSTSTPSPFLSDLARKYAIEIHINEQSTGIVGDWNFAFKLCSTKYLTLAHQDDLYLPDYTERCIHAAEKKKNDNALIIFTNYNEFENDQPKKRSTLLFIKQLLLLPFIFKNNIGNKMLKKIILSFGNSISCPTVMFNVKNTGTFEFSEEYQYNMDWEAWLRLAAIDGKFIYIKRKLMIHRLHKDSQTSIQIINNNRSKEEEKIFRMIWNKQIARFLMIFYRLGARLNSRKMSDER